MPSEYMIQLRMQMKECKLFHRKMCHMWKCDTFALCFVSIIILFFVVYLGLLDSITSTAEAKDCPGVCVHSLATIICYEVLEDIQCPSSNMKCCVESKNATSAGSQSTTQKPTKTTTVAVSVTKPTQKLEKPTKSETNKDGLYEITVSIACKFFFKF